MFTYLSMPSSMFFLKIVFLGLLSPGEGMGDGTFREDGLGKGGGLCLTFSPACNDQFRNMLKYIHIFGNTSFIYTYQHSIHTKLLEIK